LSLLNRPSENRIAESSLNAQDLEVFLNAIQHWAIVVNSDLELIAENIEARSSDLFNKLVTNSVFLELLENYRFNSEHELKDIIFFEGADYEVSLKRVFSEFILLELNSNQLALDSKAGTEIEKSRFEVLIEHAPEAILLWDYEKKRYIEANPNAIKLFGYSKDELRNLHLGELSPEYQPDGSHSATTSAIRIKAAMGGEDVVFEWVIKRKSGEETPCEVRVVRLPAKDKILMRSSIIDITERKAADERLRHSELRFRKLYDNTLFGVASLETNLHITEVNPTLCKMLGYSRDELLTMSLIDITHPGDIDQNIDFFKQATKDRSIDNYQIEKRYITKSGDLFYGLISTTYVAEGESGPYVVAAIQDITNSYLAKRNFQRSENQLRAFVKDNPMPVAMLDRDFNYITVSKEWLQSFPSEFESDVVGKNHLELHPNIPLRWTLSYQKAIVGERVSKERDFLLSEDGVTAWYRWDVTPWFDHDGSIGGIIIFLENITEKVESENKLREQEYMFHSVFDSSSIGWLVCDMSETRKKLLEWKEAGVDINDENFSDHRFAEFISHFKILSYNRQTRDIFGFDDQQLITSKRLMTFFKDGYKQLFSKELRAIFNESSSFETEFEIENAQGVRKNIYLSVNYPTEDFNKVIYGLLDITDLRSSIYALRDSETRYRTMFDTNRLGVIYANSKNDSIRFNPAFQEMFGYTNQELIDMEENDILLPEYLQKSNHLYESLRRGDLRNFQIEKQYRRKNGEILFANTSVTGLYDQKDQYYGSVTILEDVTENKRDQLFIEQQNSELKKINAELDQFVYSAAHDLRAPIANVKGLIQLIKTEKLEPQALEYVNLQEKSLEKLDDFINNIVNFSRNARLELSVSEIDLEELIQESINHHRYSPNANRLKASIRTDNCKTVVSDVNRLNVIVNNLVSNSIRYMDLNKDENYLDVDISCTGDSVKFVFKDNGVGIRTEDQDKIFDLFYRAHQNSKGTGIGLYLVRETVKKLGGDIFVKSVESKSTEFEFFIKNQTLAGESES